ncbi:MAG: ABC transporter ATP-binding protein [Bacteroidia bacterium]|nr:ABC transporter ATP-binding protein [Bacteroidia bacterium]MBP7438118.1 ABC transporter ATP-binding protein [Bacteroidia bacterium]
MVAVTPYILETRRLCKSYHDPVEFQALKNIDLGIRPGEFISIVGASGSGKSTLLYVISTLDTDYSGEILLDGVHLDKLTPNQQAEIRNEKIGFVFQFHYLLPEFTVLENVMLPALKLNRKSLEQIEADAMKKLDMLGLSDQALKRANKLSGGQQQRAAIARALINDPAIVFGDEPTGNLDSKNSQLVIDIFKDLKRSLNQTICIVTHDMQLAAQTDRTITLHDGEIVPSPVTA